MNVRPGNLITAKSNLRKSGGFGSRPVNSYKGHSKAVDDIG